MSRREYAPQELEIEMAYARHCAALAASLEVGQLVRLLAISRTVKVKTVGEIGFQWDSLDGQCSGWEPYVTVLWCKTEHPDEPEGNHE